MNLVHFNKKWLLPISFLLLFISGCSQISMDDQNETPEFVFRSLDLQQRDPSGINQWHLKSDKAQYNMNERLFRAINPIAIVYRENIPFYKITANKLTSIKDGELLTLEGKVLVNQLLEYESIIKGDFIEWLPKKSKINFVGKTIFSRIVPRNKSNNKSTLSLEAINTTLSLDSGDVVGLGPIKGFRNYYTKGIKHSISADTLSGNIKKGFLELHKCNVSDFNNITTNANKCVITFSAHTKNRINTNSLTGNNNTNDKGSKSNKETENFYFTSKDFKVETTITIPFD